MKIKVLRRMEVNIALCMTVLMQTLEGPSLEAGLLLLTRLFHDILTTKGVQTNREQVPCSQPTRIKEIFKTTPTIRRSSS